MPTRAEVIQICRQITLFNLLVRIGQTSVQCIQWMQQIGLVPYLNPSFLSCPETHDPTHVMARSRKQDLILKYEFYCQTCRNQRRIRKKITHAMATNTCLSGTHLTPHQVLYLTYGFVAKIPVISIHFMLVWPIKQRLTSIRFADKSVVNPLERRDKLVVLNIVLK